MARGNYIYPPEPTMRLTTDIFEYCRENVPKWNTISISGYHIREKGCSAVQEVAFTLSNAIAYVEAALERGLKIDEFAPRLAFFFNCHNNVFQEIAKFRAVRRMWAKIVARALRRRGPELDDDPLPHPDRRRHAAGPAARGQHHPRRPAGLRRGQRRHPVAAHQRLRRGAGAADRALGPDRAAHPAGDRLRVRGRRHRRPVRRLLLRRVADRRDRAARLGADGARSRSWAARSSRSTSCSARSRSRRSATTSATRAARTSSSASTSSSPTRSTTSTSSRSTPRPSSARWRACKAFKERRDQAAVDARLADAARRRPRRGQPAAPDPGGARRRRLDRRGLRRDARRLRQRLSVVGRQDEIGAPAPWKEIFDVKNLKRHLNVANVLSAMALFVALSGVTYAATAAKNWVKAEGDSRQGRSDPKLKPSAVAPPARSATAP